MTRSYTRTRRTRRAFAPVLAASALPTLGTAGPAAADGDQLWTYSDPYELILPGAHEDGSAPERTVTLKVSHDDVANPVGAAGTLHCTAVAGDLTSYPVETRVTVGNGPDLTGDAAGIVVNGRPAHALRERRSPRAGRLRCGGSLVGPVGLEPTTNGLKVHCSAN